MAKRKKTKFSAFLKSSFNGHGKKRKRPLFRKSSHRGRRKKWKLPLFLKVGKGGIEMRGGTVRDMRSLTDLSQRVQKPYGIIVSKDRFGINGYEGNGKGKTLFWCIVGFAVIGIGAIGRWIYKKLFKRPKRPKALPGHFQGPVIDVPYEEVVESQPMDGQNTLDPKKWSEWFLEEYGPMPELPPTLRFVVERSPDGYEVAMVGTLLCALAALCFSKVRAKYLDGKVHAPNLQVLVEGNWGAGKDKFMTALNALFKRLFDRDKAKYSSSDEGSIIQWAGIGATESKFIDILANNGEVHVLMVSSEVLSVVNNMKKQNGLTAEYFRKAFDNGEVYRANKSKDIQGLFRVFMNCILTGTKGDTNMFSSRDVEGGTASRICWLEIPDSGRFLESLLIEEGEELERLRDQIDEWNRLYCYDHDVSSGCDIPAQEHLINLDYVNIPIKNWIENDQWHKANGDSSNPRFGARGRMGAIAFHFAMVIHMLFGCPGPDKSRTRRKVVDLTIYLANYCMERFLFKFGDIQKAQREFNNQEERVGSSTPSYCGYQQSPCQSDENNYYGGFSKAAVKKMVQMYVPGLVGYKTIAKKFGLTGDAGKKTVERAIKKYREDQKRQNGK